MWQTTVYAKIKRKQENRLHEEGKKYKDRTK